VLGFVGLPDLIRGLLAYSQPSGLVAFVISEPYMRPCRSIVPLWLQRVSLAARDARTLVSAVFFRRP